MDADSDLLLKQYLVNLNNSLAQFTDQVNENLLNIANDINRCQSNFLILEKKILNIQDS